MWIDNLTLTGTAPLDGYGNALNNVLTGNSANNFCGVATGLTSSSAELVTIPMVSMMQGTASSRTPTKALIRSRVW